MPPFLLIPYSELSESETIIMSWHAYMEMMIGQLVQIELSEACLSHLTPDTG